MLENRKIVSKSRNKKDTKDKIVQFGKGVWILFNSPVLIALLVSTYIGGYYLPDKLTRAQLTFQEQLRYENARYQFSVSLLDLAWQRQYLAKNVFWNKRDNTQTTQDWSEYAAAVKEWNYRYIGEALTPRLCRGAPCRKV